MTDFGLAKNIDDDSGLTGTGAIIGTPGFMPPEQAEGRTLEIGPLADVYSIGAILFALLTGQPPFRGETVMETLWEILRTPAPAPSQINPAVDADLETICLKCLEKDPARRYASAAELADELERYLDGRPIFARPVSPSERAWRWCRRNPAVASLLTFAVVAVVAGICFSTYFGLSAREEARIAGENLTFANGETRRALAATQLANDRRDQAVRAEQLAEQRRGEAVAAEQQANTEKQRALDAEKKAKQETERALAAEKRANEEKAKALAAEKRAKEAQHATSLALTRSRLALAEVYYRDADTFAMLGQLNRVPVNQRSDEWRYLHRAADVSARTVQVPLENIPSASLRFAASIPHSGGRFAWHGDKFIWRQRPGGDALALVDRDDPTRVIYQPPGEYARVVVARDADVPLLWPKGIGHLLVVRDVTTKPQEIKIGYNRVLNSLAISPDGNHVVAIEYKGRLSVWDAKTGRGRMEKLVDSGGKLSNNLVTFLSNDRVVGMRELAKNRVFAMLAMSPAGRNAVSNRSTFRPTGT